MQLIEEYILLPKSERQKHLRLDEPCIERGGNSIDWRGLLADFLDTTLPINGRVIHCCHACNNAKCSNKYHLYFGTPKENLNDGDCKTPWERLVANTV